jgi:hypothetical protein
MGNVSQLPPLVVAWPQMQTFAEQSSREMDFLIFSYSFETLFNLAHYYIGSSYCLR